MRIAIPIFFLSFIICCSNPSSSKKDMESDKVASRANKISPDSLKRELAEDITFYIKSGFFEKEEAFQNIQDMYYEDSLDEPWVLKEIDKQYNQRLTEQKSWEKETDFDRLVKVFDRLNSSGIVALHYPGMTRQDGEGEAEDIHDTLKAKGINTRGYCFYHGQDVERAIDGDNLYLAFGDFDQNDKAGTAIGIEIVAALHEKGFKTEWNGSIEERIQIVGMKWQKRFGNDNTSKESAIQTLSKK